jgi:predicted phosphoadenosine phosphosulfate sulfurtransferase
LKKQKAHRLIRGRKRKQLEANIDILTMSQNTATSLSSNPECRLEEEQLVNTILQNELETMPENTKKAYLPKIKEFVEWCQSRNDSATVTPAKVSVFLDKEIINKEVQKGEKWSGVKRGKSTINHYVNALTKLWAIQVNQSFSFCIYRSAMCSYLKI